MIKKKKGEKRWVGRQGRGGRRAKNEDGENSGQGKKRGKDGRKRGDEEGGKKGKGRERRGKKGKRGGGRGIS